MLNGEYKYNVGFHDSYSENSGPYIKLVAEHTDREEFREVERKLAGIAGGEPDGVIEVGIDKGTRCLVSIINIPEKPTQEGIERFRDLCRERGFTKVKVDQIFYR